jgi:endonuclease YncB( thermonuclease family)
MTIKTRWVVVFVFAFSFLVCQQVNAAAITGRVVEVNDGDEITIFNLNRKVRIKLMAIDAPEKDQAFGAAAKQHLFDLVHDKFVSVEYQGVGQHSILIGRVLAEGNDICAQMVRDGAAWFDLANQNLLTEDQRQIYSLSEQAARSEKRGLWQSADAVAPWEFVKAQELKNSVTPTSQRTASTSSEPPKRVKPFAELNSMGLLRTGSGLPKPAPGQYIESNDTAWLDGPYRKNWRRFKPAGENFAALLPADGEQATKSITTGDRSINVTYYRTRDGRTLFELVWFKGPSRGEDDETAIRSGLNSIVEGVGGDIEATTGMKFNCVPLESKSLSSNGYAGAEFDMSQCTVPGMARVYTKMVGEDRQFYLGFTFFPVEDDNVMKFLNSFVVVPPGTDVKKTAKN